MSAVVILGMTAAPVPPVRAESPVEPPAAVDPAGHGLAGGGVVVPGLRPGRQHRLLAPVPEGHRGCLAVDHDRQVAVAQAPLGEAIDQIRRSALGDWLVRQAAARDVTICIDDATELEAHYQAHLRLIGLNGRLGPAGRVVFLAHELAHVPQHPRFSNSRHFSPEDMLLLHRIREATAEAVATRVLWQLRERGIDGPWNAKLATAYGDIAAVFEAAMAGERGQASELWATRTAFFHWFEATWRPAIYDDLMLKTLARIARDRIGLLPASRWLSDSFVREIAWYGGQSFLIVGDGQALMDSFALGAPTADLQARLDAIVASSGEGARGQAGGLAPIEGSGLSASSRGPVAAGPSD